MSEKVISKQTLRTPAGKNVTEILEKVYRKGNKQITKKVRRISLYKRKSNRDPRKWKKFGKAALPGNEFVSEIGPEVFIEPPPSAKSIAAKRKKTERVTEKESSSFWTAAATSTMKKEEGKQKKESGVGGSFAGAFMSGNVKTGKKPRETPEERRATEYKRTTFIDNLPDDMDEDNVADMILSNMTISERDIVRINMPLNNKGSHYGRAFVVFSTEEIAQTAINTLTGLRMGHCIVYVQLAKPKKAKIERKSDIKIVRKNRDVEHKQEPVKETETERRRRILNEPDNTGW